MNKERKFEIARKVIDTLLEKRKIEIGDRVYIWNMFNATMDNKLFIIPQNDYLSKKEYIVTETGLNKEILIKELRTKILFDLVLYDPETKKLFRSNRISVRLCDGEKLLPEEIANLTEEEKEFIKQNYNLENKKTINPNMN